MGEGENEFPALLQRLSSLAATNVTASQGGGSAIASYRGAAGDESLQTEAGHHVLTMCAARPARFEGRNSRARSLVYVKQPGALCLVPAGVTPPVRSRTEFELLVCVLDVPFVEGVDVNWKTDPLGTLICRSISRIVQHSSFSSFFSTPPTRTLPRSGFTQITWRKRSRSDFSCLRRRVSFDRPRQRLQLCHATRCDASRSACGIWRTT
jgi:hypothetical protein